MKRNQIYSPLADKSADSNINNGTDTCLSAGKSERTARESKSVKCKQSAIYRSSENWIICRCSELNDWTDSTGVRAAELTRRRTGASREHSPTRTRGPTADSHYHSNVDCREKRVSSTQQLTSENEIRNTLKVLFVHFIDLYLIHKAM